MSKMKYDPKSGTFVESEGWRSWGCVTALLHYWVTMMVIVWWMGVLGLVLAIPFILMAILFGVSIAAVFGFM
jgi:hypothetical protein